MAEKTEFRALMRRVIAGDGRARDDLARAYQPVLHRCAHDFLFHPGVRRILGSLDLANDVWKSFFEGLDAGQFGLGGSDAAGPDRGRFALESPAQLEKLLQAMAFNKAVNEVRRHTAARRGGGRVGTLEYEPASTEPSPEDQVANLELARKARQLLAPGEWRLFCLHQIEGLSWDDIATRVGGKPNTLCRQLARALERVGRDLGFPKVNRDLD